MKSRWISVVIIFIILITSAVCVTAQKRQRERLIRRLPIQKNEPLIITEIKVDGRSVPIDKEFLAEDDWMKSLVISVKNTSDKRILFATLDFVFYRAPGSDPPIAGFDIFYGNYLLRSRPPTASESLAGLAPKEIADLQMSVNEFQALQELLRVAGLPPGVEKLNIKLGEVIFEDDTMWYVGAEFRREKDLTSWKRVTSSQIVATVRRNPQSACPSLKGKVMKTRFSLFLGFVACLFLSMFYPASTAQNVNQRSIGRLPIDRNEPLRIKAVKTQGRQLRRNQKFDADGDWLKDLTVTIKKVSGKKILFASIDLFFRPPTDPKAAGSR